MVPLVASAEICSDCVPAMAVSINAQGTRVAVVRDGALTWKRVEIEGDLGDRLAISTGLEEGDVVVAAPSDRMVRAGASCGAPRLARGPQ